MLIETIFTNEDDRLDPTKSSPIVQRLEDNLLELIDRLKMEVIEALPNDNVKMHEMQVTPGQIILKKIYAEVDRIIAQGSKDSRQTILDAVTRSYQQGQLFALIRLGQKPSLPVKNKGYYQKVVGDRVTKSQSDFSGILDAGANSIKQTIGNGVIEGKTVGTIVEELSMAFDKVSKSRAATMVRTETMKAVNDGVKDEYLSNGVEKFVRLENEDEKTCDDWEFNVGGKTYMGCAGIDGEVFTVDEADEIDAQTHPNCRGTWVPYDESMG